MSCPVGPLDQRMGDVAPDNSSGATGGVQKAGGCLSCARGQADQHRCRAFGTARPHTVAGLLARRQPLHRRSRGGPMGLQDSCAPGARTRTLPATARIGHRSTGRPRPRLCTSAIRRRRAMAAPHTHNTCLASAGGTRGRRNGRPIGVAVPSYTYLVPLHKAKRVQHHACMANAQYRKVVIGAHRPQEVLSVTVRGRTPPARTVGRLTKAPWRC